MNVGDNKMPRLFTAIEIPNDLDKELNQYVPAIEQIVAQDIKHVTLHFIGNVTEQTAAAIELDLISVNLEPFELSVAGCQIFKSRGPRKAFVANVLNSEPLTNIYQRIGSILSKRGVKLERRKYAPHITLARLYKPSDSLVDSLIKKAQGISIDLSVSGFVLYSVENNPKPSYVKRREYVLRKTTKQQSD